MKMDNTKHQYAIDFSLDSMLTNLYEVLKV